MDRENHISVTCKILKIYIAVLIFWSQQGVKKIKPYAKFQDIRDQYIGELGCTNQQDRKMNGHNLVDLKWAETIWTRYMLGLRPLLHSVKKFGGSNSCNHDQSQESLVDSDLCLDMLKNHKPD